MNGIRRFRAVVLVVALAPIFGVLSLVARALPAGAVTDADRQEATALIQQFNDDCSRANPPDECQTTGNDACLRANPPDECSRPAELFAGKQCVTAARGGLVCEVVIVNVSDTPATNVVVRDVMQPPSFHFDSVVFGQPGEEVPINPCRVRANTAQCKLGTVQPSQRTENGGFFASAVVVGFFHCPPGASGGTNTATVTSRNAPSVTVSAPIDCSEQGPR